MTLNDIQDFCGSATFIPVADFGINSTFIDSVRWTFPAGSVPASSTALSPGEITLDTIGQDLLVCVTAYNLCDSSRTCVSFNILEAPLINIVADKDTLCRGESIIIDNNSTGDNLSFNWEVTPAAGVNISNITTREPTIEFSGEIGDYVLTATIGNDVCGFLYWNQDVHLTAAPAVSLAAISDFCSSETITPIPTYALPLSYMDSVRWSFAGANPSFSSDYFPENIDYTLPGSYEICVTVYNRCDSAQACQSFRILEPLVAQATLSGNFSCAVPFQVTATNQSVGDDQSYSWSIEGIAGSIPASVSYNASAASPVFTFSESGSYIVKLTLFNANNICPPAYWTDTVQILLPPTVTLPDYDRFCESVCLSPIANYSTGTAAVDSVAWNFPGGSTAFSNDFAPDSICYQGPGTFSYNVEVFNVCGMATASDAFIIDTIPLMNLGPVDTFCLSEGPMSLFSATPVGGIWSGPGIVAPGNGLFNPAAVTLTGPLTTVQVTYTYENGICVVSEDKDVLVIDMRFVEGGPDVNICISVDSVQLNGGTPSGGWYEGPGIINDIGIFSPEGLSTSGSYTITYYYQLPFTDCIGADTFRVFVRPLPVPNFDVTDSLCVDVAAIYENTTLGGSTYLWTFDDGASYTQTSPSHAFSSTGDHQLQLYATSQYGCVDSISGSVYVSGPPEASFEKDTSQGCAVLPVNFTNTSIGYQFVQYAWNFGNQENSNLEQPATIFYEQGLEDTLYYVQLLATNHCGNDLATDSILVFPKPLARPYFSQLIGCTPLAVSFNNLSRGLPDSYAWYIDGQLYSVDSVPPTRIFRAEGVDNEYYDILFVATNECGIDSILQTITVLPDSIRPFFSIPVNFGCEPFSLYFENTTAPDSNIIYNWFFGNGDTSTEESPTYTFYATGDTATIYQVTLVADNGCSVNSITVPITVYPIPPVSFDVSPIGCARDTVFFTNTSTDAAGFMWDFGDGGSSEMTDATHVFDQGGWYFVSLTGYGIGTGCPSTYTDSVFVRQIPTAAFDVDSTFGCPPHTAYFTNLSQGALYYRWYFGDGNQAVGSNPGGHVYNQTGYYSITLTAIDEYACEHDTSFSFVQVYPTPSPDFSTLRDQPCGVPVTVCFEDTGIGGFAYNWDFGNGEMSTDTEPCTDYTTAGNYQITMRVRNEFLCERTKTDTITIYERPIADFSVDSDIGCAIEPLLLFNNSQYADEARWYFSDGFTSSEWVPERLLDTGTYSATLIVSNPSGCEDTLSLDPLIRVYPSPTAAFAYEELGDELPTTFAFTDTSSPDAVTFGWDFDDGSTSNEQNPVHRFLSSFDKLVAHWVTNTYGCPDTAYVLIDLDTLGGLFIPNILEPDDESRPEKNIFQPKGIGLREYHIAVYARNGQLMWESSSLSAEGMPDEFWDGTYQGEKVPAGVYVWRVHLARYFNGQYWKGMLDDRGNLSRSGFIYLVR